MHIDCSLLNVEEVHSAAKVNEDTCYSVTPFFRQGDYETEKLMLCRLGWLPADVRICPKQTLLHKLLGVVGAGADQGRNRAGA